MSTLLILLVVAVAGYVLLGATASRGQSRGADSVAEFNRALAALNPHRGRRARRRPTRPAPRTQAARPRPARTQAPGRRAA